MIKRLKLPPRTTQTCDRGHIPPQSALSHGCLKTKAGNHTMLLYGCQALMTLKKVSLLMNTTLSKGHPTHSTPLKSSPPLPPPIPLPPFTASWVSSLLKPSESDSLFKGKPHTCEFQPKLWLRHRLWLTQLPQILNFWRKKAELVCQTLCKLLAQGWSHLPH